MTSTEMNSTAKRNDAEQRISRIASILQAGTRLWAAITVLIFLGFTLWLIWLPTAVEGIGLISMINKLASGNVIFKSKDYLDALTLNSKYLLFALLASYTAWALYCISRLHRLFGNFLQNNIFVQQNTKLLRCFGYALIAGIALSWAIPSLFWLLTFALSDNWIQHLPDDISISTNHVLGLIGQVVVIGMIFLTAWVLEIGRELYNDTEYTV